ncbi:hypothetical protein K0M31_009946 [Melipona bicolor]|uniref:Uncharacterized protein n=1 Tax=Melipona bicolor TaxID=60889 RepID=A0AA40FNM8_9HYME|nr:hypothetical protein K0M31_009946 [Melipona bicolor]
MLKRNGNRVKLEFGLVRFTFTRNVSPATIIPIDADLSKRRSRLAKELTEEKQAASYTNEKNRGYAIAEEVKMRESGGCWWLVAI